MKLTLLLCFLFAHTSLVYAKNRSKSPKVLYQFPGSESHLVPELDKKSFAINEGNDSLLKFVAWSYGENKPVAARGQVVCEFLGFKTYVDSTIKESKETSVRVVIPMHTNNCYGTKYCWGWQNAQQDGDYPEFSEYKKNRYGWIAPFMVFESLTCTDKIGG